MLFWLIAGVVALVLFALAWWSSGRARAKPGRADAHAETNRGWAVNQAVINRESGPSGGAGL